MSSLIVFITSRYPPRLLHLLHSCSPTSSLFSPDHSSSSYSRMISRPALPGRTADWYQDEGRVITGCFSRYLSVCTFYSTWKLLRDQRSSGPQLQYWQGQEEVGGGGHQDHRDEALMSEELNDGTLLTLSIIFWPSLSGHHNPRHNRILGHNWMGFKFFKCLTSSENISIIPLMRGQSVSNCLLPEGTLSVRVKTFQTSMIVVVVVLIYILCFFPQ